MRNLRSEAIGGYDLGGLVALLIAFLAVGVFGLVMLAVAGLRFMSGRPAWGYLRTGLIIVIPGLLIALTLR